MIEIKNLEKKYGNFYALNNVSFNIEDGEFIAVVGASGSGKSTLLNILGSIDVATSGQVIFDGIEVGKLTEREKSYFRNRTLGYVFQSFNLDLSFTVYENIEVPLIFAGYKREKRKSLVENAINAVGLKGKEKMVCHSLSGGEKQRVAIARAIVNSPKIILADEPCGNLDSENGKKIMGLLEDINKRGTTIILVTHNLEHAGKAKRIIKLSDGAIV